jgi:hypothetical protein
MCCQTQGWPRICRLHQGPKRSVDGGETAGGRGHGFGAHVCGAADWPVHCAVQGLQAVFGIDAVAVHILLLGTRGTTLPYPLLNPDESWPAECRQTSLDTMCITSPALEVD